MNSRKETDPFLISKSVSSSLIMNSKSRCWLIQLIVLTVFFVNILIMMRNYEYWMKSETGKLPLVVSGPQHRSESTKNMTSIKEVPSKVRRAFSKNITIKVISSGRYASVSIDGFPVYYDNHTRGIHLVVINQYTGNIMATKAFDTFSHGIEKYMAEYLSTLRKGMILVFAVRDEASWQLTKVGRGAIRSLGSHQVDKVGWRDTWVFICKNKVQWIDEKLNKPPSKQAYGKDINLATTVTLDSTEKQCKWGKSPSELKRSQFCSMYIGYGDLCDCHNPAPVDLKSPPLEGSRVTAAPVSIIASNRPNYLYQMLSKLLVTPGVEKQMITVYADGFHDEVIALLDMLEVQVVEHMLVCSGSCEIHQNYKFALNATFEKHPKAEFMIILEEDLEVAEDIMDYFSQMIPILLSDESIYCISAWNDNGFKHSSNDPALAYRVEGMPGLGWILKRTLWEEIGPKWPNLEYKGDWDLWMRQTAIRGARECITPDIPRTFHLGKIGVHQNSYIDSLYNETATTVLNNNTGNKFDTSKLTKQGYEDEIIRLLQIASPLNHTKNPCNDTDFIPDTQGKTYVIYIKWAFKGDHETWMNLAECLHLWSYDVRGYHNIMWRFWMKRNHILVVGSTSPYYSHKPKGINPVVITDAMMGKRRGIGGYLFDMEKWQGYAI